MSKNERFRYGAPGETVFISASTCRGCLPRTLSGMPWLKRVLPNIIALAAPYFPEGILHIVSVLVSFAVVALLFAMTFKWMPDVMVGWRDVWLGAVLTAFFFEVGKAAIGVYIGKQGLESTYGAAASIVVVLIWVYYTSQIILMGAEITHAYAKHKGSIKQREPLDALEGASHLGAA
jgi:uncharacterized BrkB/YihY/UPF0761 family membrane protein